MLLHLARRLSPDDIRQPNPGGIDFIHNVLQVLFSVFAITLLKQDICLYCVSSHTLLNQSLQLHRVFYTHLHTLSLYLIWISTALSTGNSIHYTNATSVPRSTSFFKAPQLYTSFQNYVRIQHHLDLSYTAHAVLRRRRGGRRPGRLQLNKTQLRLDRKGRTDVSNLDRS